MIQAIPHTPRKTSATVIQDHTQKQNVGLRTTNMEKCDNVCLSRV